MVVLRFCILIISTFLCTAGAAWSQDADRTALDLIGKARESLKKDPQHGRPEAERLIRQALDLWRQSPTANKEGYADASVMLALLLLGDGRSEGARPVVEEAIRVYEQISPGAEKDKVALALEALGAIYRSQGDTAQAEPFRKRAGAIRARIIQEMQKADDVGRPPMDTPMGIGGNVSRPLLREKPEPMYSFAGRLAKLQGSVVLRVVIDTDGTTRNVTMLHSLGFGLDEAAYQAVRAWRFEPATLLNGQPVPVSANVEINFRLL